MEDVATPESRQAPLSFPNPDVAPGPQESSPGKPSVQDERIVGGAEPSSGLAVPKGTFYEPLPPRPLDSTGVEEAYYRLFREWFNKAERRRRWSLEDDIPWDKVNPAMDPAVADVVESFCAVELYLPDYIAKIIPVVRASRGRAWFHANWGYEEAKHSMALGDWLLRSGARTEEQMADLECRVYAHDWNLPYGSALGMVLYAMVQELATWLHYKNLRYRVDERGDPALSTLLRLIYVDERSHHDFYKQVAQIYLEKDRAGTLELLREVLSNFSMPAVNLLADSKQRETKIRGLNIFNEEIYYSDVIRPMLASLGVTWSEVRERKPGRKTLATTGKK